MSDYEKPTKKCVDAPFGFRTAMQLAENQDATKALLEVEHVPQLELPQFATGFGDLGGGPAQQLGGGVDLDYLNGGQHDTPKVARGSLRVELDDLFSVGSDVLITAFRSGVCTGFTRIGVGSYFVPIVGLSDYDCHVWPLLPSSGSTTRLIQQTPASSGPPGIYVSLWEAQTLESSNVGFALTDFSFQLAVYGFGEGETTPLAVLAKVPSRFSPGPMAWWPSRARGRGR